MSNPFLDSSVEESIEPFKEFLDFVGLCALLAFGAVMAVIL